jgi:pimeloyl-ACP methyl ester carboxylesterase
VDGSNLREVRCATLTVPVDYADPRRGWLDMAVIRVRAADQRDRIGSLVLNPGGPGLSGADFAPWWASWLPDALLARIDVVSFDPRGTARSASIRCRVLPADPATQYSGGVALARALGPSAKLSTVSGEGHTAFGRSPCVAKQVTLYLVELRVPGGRAC